MVQTVGTIDCGGFAHRLAVDDEDLRALDHEDEAAQVFDALTGRPACLLTCDAWQRLVHRFDDSEQTSPDFTLVDALVPDVDDAHWYTGHHREALEFGDRIDGLVAGTAARESLQRIRDNARHDRLLLELPENLRTALALIWVGHTLDAGGVADPLRARRLRLAVTQCWQALGDQGVPSSEARRRLVWDLRKHRWGPPH